MILLSVILTTVGFLIASDYGRSVDEPLHRTYAAQTLEVYAGLRQPSNMIANLKYYGPTHNLFSHVSSHVLQRLIPSWGIDAAWHFAQFLSFVLATVSIYILSIRFVKYSTAMAIALLFASQPLYFGHAFINPKDIPFMSLFLSSVALGYVATYAFQKSPKWNDLHVQSHGNGVTSFFLIFGGRWRRANQYARALFLLSISILILLGISFVNGAFGLMMESLLRSAYAGDAWNPTTLLFRLVAEDAWKTPIEAYIDKLQFILPWIGILVYAWSLLMSIFLISRVFGTGPLRSQLRRNLPWITLIAAAVLLGATISIRVGGVFAGLLVTVQLIVTRGKKAIGPLIIYGILAGAFAYATWPFLWGNPIANFWEAASLMINFKHSGLVLYRGDIYYPRDIPLDYFPNLAFIQFTEPAILLGLAGILAYLFGSLIRKQILSRDLLAIFLWLVVPMGMYLAMKPPLYDNFRQLLFITPPLFIFAALALDRLTAWVKPDLVKLLILIGVILPGIHGIITLHPHQYVYYNSFVGGVGGAQGYYATDYWGASTKEAIQHVNEIADLNASVGIWPYEFLAEPFARKDLQLHLIETEQEVLDLRPDYVIVVDRLGFANTFMTYLPASYAVERSGATLAFVRVFEWSEVSE